MRLLVLVCVSLALSLVRETSATAATIVAADIPSSQSSFTTPDGLVTLTPTAGGNPSTIGGAGSGCCFGVGNDQVNDTDGDPNTTADQEKMAIALQPTAYLDSLSFIFTRATTKLTAPVGPADDGIRISGFASNPGVSYYSEDNPIASLNNIPEVEGVSFSGDTLIIDHAWRGGAITVFAFANPLATLGQTLTLTVADRDEANPQANFRTITYSVAPEVNIPEPSSVMLIAISLVAMCTSRRVH